MSDDIRTGIKSRKIMTIMAAVFAVAMMLAVPFVVAIDSDADFTKDDAGYSIELKDPTDEQLSKVGVDKADDAMEAIYYEMMLFNGGEFGVFSDPVMTSDSYEATTASGQKITSDSMITITTNNINAKNVKITMNVTDNGKLISPYISYMPDKLKAAADAIAAYIGENVSIGDKVEITGDINVKSATQVENKYKFLSDNKCVIEKEISTTYGVEDVDLTIKMIRADSTTKEIQLRSTVKGLGGSETTYTYDDDNVVVGTHYTTKTENTESFSGDEYYVVDGKEYSLITEGTELPSEGIVTAGDIFNQSDIKVDPDYAIIIAALPASEDGMKIEKTYAAAESAFDNVVMEAVGNDLLKLILIIGGVILGIIVLIIILIIVLVVLKKKKKQ